MSYGARFSRRTALFKTHGAFQDARRFSRRTALSRSTHGTFKKHARHFQEARTALSRSTHGTFKKHGIFGIALPFLALRCLFWHCAAFSGIALPFMALRCLF